MGCSSDSGRLETAEGVEAMIAYKLQHLYPFESMSTERQRDAWFEPFTVQSEALPRQGETILIEGKPDKEYRVERVTHYACGFVQIPEVRVSSLWP